jgi:hypothetical protein
MKKASLETPDKINEIKTRPAVAIIKDKPYSVLRILPSNENGFLNII